MKENNPQKKAKRPNKILDKVIASSKARGRKSIGQWRSALQQAESVDNPRRTLLYNLYDELVIDAHLTSELDKRNLAIRGTSFSLFKKEDGKTDMDKTELFTKPWFFDFIDHYTDTLAWGHSLLQIGDIVDGEISEITLVNRRHVIPEKGLFVFRQSDEKGIYYREDKKYNNYLIELGKKDNLGLLNKTAPHVLYKRFAQSSWSELCEIFGMPMRIGKTNVKNLDSVNRMENMMINMSSAFWAVVDNDEMIEHIESPNSKGEVYDNLIKLSNSEMSKLINSAVIGEASEGGSRSKEEVGERTANMITLADKQFLEGFINNTLIPKLIAIGYELEGFAFRFEKNKDIKELWTITQGLLGHYDIEPEYITNTFGIPVTKKEKQEPKKLNTDTDFFA